MLRRALRSLTTQVAAGVDQVFYSTALARSEGSRRRSAVERLDHEQRMKALALVRQEYGNPGYLTEPASFFPEPPAEEGRLTRVRSLDLGLEVSDLRWRSRFVPIGKGVAARYASHEENHIALARLYLRTHERRPAVVLIHGYLGGDFAIEERVMPVRWLLDQGLDVALFVLPFHGERRRRILSRPVFPSSDPRFTIEGFRQAVQDVRWLLRWLLARGAPAVGVLGMSLGGYTTSLLATVEPRLAFAVLLVPLACLADFAREGGRLVGTPEQQALQYEALKEVFRVVSPLGRPPVIPPDRVVILAGEGDRITPIAHAQCLASHFGASLETFPGGHLLQLGRGRALAPLARLLNQVTPP
ncbi:MAG: alpha/beta hydrolase family protein [Myxococcales bacterium]|nr:alpha/beta hydrolase [Polyangiaceae bacterium]MDW8251370.1 alpha/beta hydrolase family protein [Myxococcales bacterium]